MVDVAVTGLSAMNLRKVREEGPGTFTLAYVHIYIHT